MTRAGVVALLCAVGAGCSCGGECGDGEVRGREECDDGNTAGFDGCSATCTLEPFVCGNFLCELALGETCDGCVADCGDDPACPAFCGNGVVENGEACDDANEVAGDGCAPNCFWESPMCGNLVVEAGEECEPPLSVNCDASCTLYGIGCPPPVDVACSYSTPASGTETTATGTSRIALWACDPPALVLGRETAFALTIPAPGGDQLVTARVVPAGLAYSSFFGTASGGIDASVFVLPDDQGCSADEPCVTSSVNEKHVPEEARFVGTAGATYYVIVDTVSSGTNYVSVDFTLEIDCAVLPVCGDGVRDPGEECDDGNGAGGDGCDGACTVDDVRCGRWRGPVACGEVVRLDTRTDGAALVDGWPTCSLETTFGPEASWSFVAPAGDTVTVTLRGDGSWQKLFAVPGNPAAPGGCDPAECAAFAESRWTALGTLEVDVAAGETWYFVVDSPHTAGGASTMTVTCASLAGTCGNAIVDAGEACDDAGTVAGDGCDTSCAWEPAACGDGVVQLGELCDDGGTAPGDGCSAACLLECGPQPPIEIGCGVTPNPRSGDTSTSPIDTHDWYPCPTGGGSGSGLPWAGGPERYYVLRPTITEIERVVLTASVPDMDLFVLPADARSCTDCRPELTSPGTLSGGGPPGGWPARSVDVPVVAGGAYYVVVDSADEPGGTFTLEVVCQADAVCGNAVDEPGEECDDGNLSPGDGCSPTCTTESLCVDAAPPGPVVLAADTPAPLTFTPTASLGTASCGGPPLCTDDGPDEQIAATLPAGTTDLVVDYDFDSTGTPGDYLLELWGPSLFPIPGPGGMQITNACGNIGCFDPTAAPAPMPLAGSYRFAGVSDGSEEVTVWLTVDACSPLTASSVTLSLTATCVVSPCP